MNNRRGDARDHESLVEIWLASVRATHDFLSEAKIQELLPVVRDSSLEGLFLSPDWIGKGGGKMLLEHARKLKGPLSVDVSEQSPRANAFYGANDFEVVGLSETDDAGRPYPLLHMRDVDGSDR